MRSAVAVTGEMDDMRKAAEELSSRILRDLPLEANCCGILFCDSDMDDGLPVSLLGETLPFDIVGCTTVGVMEGDGGFHDMAAVLTVLTADDVRFATREGDVLAADSLKRLNLSGFYGYGELCPTSIRDGLAVTGPTTSRSFPVRFRA